MDWTMKVPCADCPFRKEGGIRLTPGRVREIGGMMLDSQGGTFPCHRTVDYTDQPDEQGESEYRQEGTGEVHCAGALIFAEVNETATQMMRIMERFGDYDHRVFTPEVKSLVWGSLREWVRSAKAKERR